MRIVEDLATSIGGVARREAKRGCAVVVQAPPQPADRGDPDRLIPGE
jgi:hypothetical protein